MRINGKDASAAAYVTVQAANTSSQRTDTSTNNAQKNDTTVNNIQKTDASVSKDFTPITETEKKELSIPEKALIDAIEKANKAIEGPNTSIQFAIHDKTHEIMVTVLDKNTKEVIREIPPEKVLDMVARLWEMAGIIVDERR